jgi:tetratricopeptide (TPR) repeat protein
VSRNPQLRWLVWLALSGCAPLLCAQQIPRQDVAAKYRIAAADYAAGRYDQAAAALEQLVSEAGNTFEIHELLGLSYASLSRNQDAIRELQAAVRLKPDSAIARTNLAASLSHAGEADLAGEQFRKALALEPNNYTANHNLGEYYVGAGKLQQAVPLLALAQKINPSAYDNGYDLATAELLTGRADDARQVAEKLLTVKDTGELHNLLGQIDEKQGNYLAAAQDYERAAHMDPSDDNLFAWGGELLIHRTYQPAAAVFQYATQRFPNSPRLQIGLGMSLYAQGKYRESVTAFLKAVDLAPGDARCYRFLAWSYDRSPQQVNDVIERFRRYAALQPSNAQAQYYYAMSLWKGKQLEQSSPDMQTIATLLKKAVTLDPGFSDAHLQMGNLYASQHNYADSISEYQRSLELDPNQPDAHYRLATDYVRLGEKDRADQQFAIYQKQRARHLEEKDKELAEVKQFVYSSRDNASGQP